MTIKQILEKASNVLRENKIEEPILHARILLSNKLKKSKDYLIIHNQEELTKEIEEEYMQDILKLAKKIPIQYITNKQEFMKLKFYVDENVLIPRADTEILVEEVISISKKIQKDYIKILDLCTGSGIIAISLAKYIKNSIVVASDISINAINVAKKNATENKVELKLILSDLFENINEKFDIIVSNPPYIPTSTIYTLDKNVQNEPIIALDGGKDGLDIYRKIIKNAQNYLNEDGYLCFEIGYDQRKSVIDLLNNTKQYSKIYSKKDLAQNDRIVIAKR